ncbi:MAG: TetR/AcrR family transcriptional regulator, partial [Phocaeicola sp.]|uniref:TetR/AcrR family transcriptional regulator n=1 Tax=Phocaeicola sp. TaxID=2773926 RepID=UPI003FA010EE
MQTLKTDIEQRILEVAHQEFIENGVQRTCIRNVARKAGVTVGNLYHYFDSKDALFCEVMRPLLTALDRYILSHNDEERLSLDVFELRQQHIDYMFSMFAIVKEFRPELRLLLFNAEGTSLEGYKNKVIDHQMQVGVEYLRLMKEP